MAEAEGESLESWLSEYPGPPLPDLKPWAAFLPPSLRGGGGGGGLWQSAPGVASPRREHPAFTPLSEQGPFPAARPQAPADDTCSSRSSRPVKATPGCFGLTGGRVGEVEVGLPPTRALGPCTPKAPRMGKLWIWAGPPGSAEWCHARTQLAASGL